MKDGALVLPRRTCICVMFAYSMCVCMLPLLLCDTSSRSPINTNMYRNIHRLEWNECLPNVDSYLSFTIPTYRIHTHENWVRLLKDNGEKIAKLQNEPPVNWPFAFHFWSNKYQKLLCPKSRSRLVGYSAAVGHLVNSFFQAQPLLYLRITL